MKILLVVHQFLPKYTAGTEIYTYNLAQELKRRGHKVYIYTHSIAHFDRKYTVKQEEYNGLNVRTIYYSPFPSGIRPAKSVSVKYSPTVWGKIVKNYYKYKGKMKAQLTVMKAQLTVFKTSLQAENYFMNLKNRFIENDFERYIETINPDIIHIHHLLHLSASIIKIAKREKMPIVLTFHDYWFMCGGILLLKPSLKRCEGPLLGGVSCPFCLTPKHNLLIILFFYPFFAGLCIYRNLYLKSILKDVDIIIAPSKFLKEKYVRYGIPEKKISVLEYGMDTKKFKDFGKEKAKNLRFGFIGTIAPHKGVHILINAFKKIKDKDIELYIYGNTSFFPSYFRKLKEKTSGVDIHFLGKFAPDDIVKILKKIDVLFFPSIWYENCPLAIHEAFLAKVPVIASKVGAISEFVKDGENGLFFHTGDVDDLAKKMKIVIDNPDLIMKLSKNIEPVKTIEENTDELERLYIQLRTSTDKEAFVS
ncbi:glycosyltransferase family 4 protein [candidate division WOR-3 bacterium]|nr:glycosyltransferase family 4 protein [candidate division WOR-3 bacterium]